MCRGASLTPAWISSAGQCGLGKLDHVMCGPGPFGVGECGAASHEASFALLGVDPAVLAQGAQRPDDCGAGDAKFGDELVL